MKDLSLDHNKSYKKSARVVGDVMGKFHPHGDSALYEALVRMAQDFSLRYPLVDGQGNFGSIDGDPAAAMRYTEVKLTKLSSQILDDLDKDTVDFIENYDGSSKEPKILPSKIPNLLLNGASGIAVGMSTNIPPHNCTELISAVIAQIKNPNLSILSKRSEHLRKISFSSPVKLSNFTSPFSKTKPTDIQTILPNSAKRPARLLNMSLLVNSESSG